MTRIRRPRGQTRPSRAVTGRKDVAIPMSAVADIREAIRLSIRKQQVEDLTGA
jgi:hypothetical protein